MGNNLTNAMRILDRNKIAYKPVFYEIEEEAFSGSAVASLIGVPHEQCFKTLTTCGDKSGVVVFVIPVDAELNLKTAAAAIGDKRIEMVSVKDLLAVTGYMRGAVSPIGMKKIYKTVIDSSALHFSEIVVSAGKKGASVLIAPNQLSALLNAQFEAVI